MNTIVQHETKIMFKKTSGIKPIQLQKILNVLGTQGWEVKASFVRPTPLLGINESETVIVLQRPIIEGVDYAKELSDNKEFIKKGDG